MKEMDVGSKLAKRVGRQMKRGPIESLFLQLGGYLGETGSLKLPLVGLELKEVMRLVLRYYFVGCFFF